MLVGIGSTVELAAMPFPPADVQLPGPTLIQQSPGSHEAAHQPAGTPRPPSGDESKPASVIELHEALTAAQEGLEELSRAADAVAATGQLQQELTALRQENQQLRVELEAIRAERGELEKARQAGEAHVAELTKTVEQATAQARQMDEKLVAVAVRWRNAQLNTSLVQARTSSDQMEAEARATQNALRSRITELEQGAAQMSAETARLRKQVEASERRIAVADSERTEAEAWLSEIRDSLQQAEQEKARIGADLARMQVELAAAKEQVAAAGQEREQIDQRAAALANERDDLRIRLADATARLGWSEAVKAQLGSEVTELREAACTAPDDARQNLIALENRVQELNVALPAIGPAAGPLETNPAHVTGSGTPSAGEWTKSQGRAAAAPVENVATVAAPSLDPEPGSAAADQERIKTASAMRPDDGEGAHLDQRGILGGRPAVFQMFADLPREKRLRVQRLLAGLHSKVDERGLMTTVPGELLFALNSDEVQVGAYETLVKVAELIGLYDNRQVLIIGHSDALGDAAHNRQLSERRAEVVKQFFVENFGLGADRLSTAGLGDARPIASNATPEGRRANRRVEVLILN
jgi:outer membrane protein OmpA-like peptidoglycan-associated protein/predicted nuclease with TOPRIM domain